MAAAVEEVPVPPQVQPPEVYDFRGFEVAPRGYKMKNKRKVEELEEQVPGRMYSNACTNAINIGFFQVLHQLPNADVQWHRWFIMCAAKELHRPKNPIFLQAELESAQMTDDPPVTVIPPAKRTKRSIVGVGKVSLCQPDSAQANQFRFLLLATHVSCSLLLRILKLWWPIPVHRFFSSSLWLLHFTAAASWHKSF